MGLFDKQEKKLRKEFNKKNTAYCREGVKDIEELHDELKAAYENLENVNEEFATFREKIEQKLSEEEKGKMDYFSKKFRKIDKVARDAVRDMKDLLRNQKKRLREAMNDE
ncbi:hypothetical protein R1T16_07105 [Flavobacterium sp. DG1-102-2]|nr:hypothetical protein [Flavobacterium sp. DG1-102-2]